MKICYKCKIEKEESFFNKDSSRKDKLHAICRECESKRSKSEKYKEKQRERKRSEKYREHDREYKKQRRKNDVQYKLRENLRKRIRNVLHGEVKIGSAVRDLGCSIDELKLYLESKWQPGMSWENWSQFGWHIDHIIPLSNFDLTNKEEFLKACHYTNLQPLWWNENLSKSNKIMENINEQN